MALVCTTQASGNFVGKTANLVDQNAVYTLMCWAQLSDTTAGNANYGLTVSSTNGVRYDTQEWQDTAGVLTLLLGVSLSTNEMQVLGTTVLARNTWYHLALVRTDTTHCLLYLNGALEATNTAYDVTGSTAGGMQNIIHYTAGLTVGAHKAWTAALTATEIFQEMQTLCPQRFANLNAWCPTFPGSGENVRDYSLTQDLTTTGAITDGNNPPVSYGAPVLWSPAPPVVATPASTRQVWMPRGRVYAPARLY